MFCMTPSFALAPPLRAQRPPNLAQWERLAQRGSHAIQAGQAELALFSFHQALAIAQDLLVDAHPSTTEHTHGCLAALVVSHHHLADLYQHVGLPAQAVLHLCQAHRSVLDSPAHNAWRHSRETHAALLLYQRSHGPHPAITALLAACVQPIGPLH
jgi:hypothetical protein